MPDSSLVTELCLSLNNFFPPIDKRSDRSFIHKGSFKIFNGCVYGMDFIKNDQFFRIVGSLFNDGVYRNNASDIAGLHDEEFTGAVWEMAVPASFLTLCDDIRAYRDNLDRLSAADKGFASESFGGYSYSLGCSAPAYLQEWGKKLNRNLNDYRRLSVL